MDNRDRAFLEDMIQLTHMNHIATAYILRSRLNSPDLLEDVAVFTLSKLRHYDTREEAVADVRAYNDAKRIERIICAKLLAELIATCEDFGALGDAIYHRAAPLPNQPANPAQPIGIFRRYLNSTTSQAADFFDRQVLAHDIPNTPGVTLDTLLNLPPLASVAGQLSPEDYAALNQSYQTLPRVLHDIAKMYRERGTAAPALTNTGPLPSDMEDEVRIILDTVPLGGASTQRGGILVRALNKTKHRFMLTERLSRYHDPAAPDTIEYGRFTPEMMDRIVENTVAVAGNMTEIAAIVQTLDKAGVAL